MSQLNENQAVNTAPPISLKIEKLQRVFVHGNVTLQDPDPRMSDTNVLRHYSNIYPELTTATVQGPEMKNDQYVYTFKTTVGTKG